MNDEESSYISSDDYLFISSYLDEEDDVEFEVKSDHVLELFPFLMTLNNPQNQLFDDSDGDPEPETDVAALPTPEILNDEIPKLPKKRGRPKKEKNASPAAPAKKRGPSCELGKKSKKRKDLTQGEKAQHNNMERERRRDLALLLERLRDKIPAVKGDKKASQKRIIDEATSLIEGQKPGFLEYLREEQKYLRLEARRRQLEKELASGPNGFLCVWEDRKDMSATDIYRRVKEEAKEDLGEAVMNEEIRILESSIRSSQSRAGYSNSSADSDRRFDVEV